MTELRDDLQNQVPAEPVQAPEEKRPVILYILIMVFAALLLMALSLLMSQRNEGRTLDRLQSSVNEIQQMQGTREELYELQRRVKELEKAQSGLEKELESEQLRTTTLDREGRALRCLLDLQDAWELRDIDLCRIILQEMADEDLAGCLPDQAREGLISPTANYNTLKQNILNWQAGAQEPKPIESLN